MSDLQPYQQQHQHQPQQYQQPYYPQPMHTVAPKSPGLALLGSFFVPGLGSLMNGNVGMGLLIFGAYVAGFFSLIILIGFLVIPAVWVWGMVDAYQGAKSWNARHGILS